MTSREKWNQRYAGAAVGAPSPLVVALGDTLPTRGRALDVAGGTGRHALWLARRGLDVTLVDVSDVAVEAVANLARTSDLGPGTLTAVRRDLETEPLPDGPWDLILVCQYLQRSLFPALADRLAPGGLLVYIQATVRNLERNARPGVEYLVGEGELRASFDGLLEVVRHDEGWRADDTHQACLLARR